MRKTAALYSVLHFHWAAAGAINYLRAHKYKLLLSTQLLQVFSSSLYRRIGIGAFLSLVFHFRWSAKQFCDECCDCEIQRF
jgi:hypothetical protein